MKFTALFCLGALASFAFAHPLESEKRQTGCYAITGLTNGGIQPRLEVREMLFKKPNQWTLFMLAMRQWMDMTQSDKLSYFTIAGIHGVPRQDWDGVGQCSACGDTDGYCPHDSVLFPGWHRAYLALFEQVFMTIVNKVAASYPSSQLPAMQGAAKTMRFPYWDWAAHPPSGSPTLPRVVSNKYVTVNGPSGSTTFINPLFRFDYQDPSGMYYGPFTTWDITYRYPNSNAATAQSQEQQCITAFDKVRPTLQSQIYQLFTACNDYLHFSNTGSGSTAACSNSLEGIHNTIHNTAGGPGSTDVSAGHMTYLATSAFDPVFWLHHMNVDRYFALWQGVYPNNYGASQAAPGKTWTIAAGSTQNQDSPLSPFHKDTSCNFWTTRQLRDTKTFGYTYPEFFDSDGSTAAINASIKALYGPSATATAGSTKRTASPEPETKRAIPWTDLKAANGSTYEYVANIATPRYALNTSYTIFMFFGEPASEDPSTWIDDANMVGLYGVTGQPGMSHMNLIIAGSIPLTQALTAKLGAGLMNTLAELHVSPFLSEMLRWKIAANGVSVDPATLPGFQVKVYASTATDPTNPSELPVYSEFVPLVNVTRHKLGGYSAPVVSSQSSSAASSGTKTTVTLHSTTTICTSSTCQASATTA